ncbi:VOC family protein [Pseudoalteromonas obscura]|uniref:VOC family protein n=1 Tax=Pseudoalteromonas obscura TaxID=3048491 RepID=A0ABT7EG91_9GAMM|nr:VOC family protein [Pseudoalteromonas sp. P94(2023)]MDK2593661.1 VOC family protein [Pseudoalteromonas sp. P94(2023)]
MKLAAIRIPCKNLNDAYAFYADKLRLTVLFGSPSEGFVGMQLQNVQLIFEPEEQGEFECGRYLGFSLAVENIDTFYREASKRGVSFSNEPEKQSWGGIMTHISDNSGNIFSVIQS